MLAPRAQVAVAVGFAVLVLATIGLGVYLVAGLGDGGASGTSEAAATGPSAPPSVRYEAAHAACTALADALEPVVPLLTPVAPTRNDAVRGQAVSGFLDATGDLDLQGWFATLRLSLATEMAVLTVAPDDAAQYAQRYADYRDTLAELADACRVQEVAVPQALPA